MDTISSKKTLLMLAILIVIIALFSGTKPQLFSTFAPPQTNTGGSLPTSFLPESLQKLLPDQNKNEQEFVATGRQNSGEVHLPDGSTVKRADAVNKQGDVFVSHSSGYQIVYLKEYGYFIIFIDGKPYEQTRQEAENSFLENVGYGSKEAACSKNAVVVSPSYAYPERAGKQERLSFCR